MKSTRNYRTTVSGPALVFLVIFIILFGFAVTVGLSAILVWAAFSLGASSPLSFWNTTLVVTAIIMVLRTLFARA